MLTPFVLRFLYATFALAALLLPVSVSAHPNHDASDEVGVHHQHRRALQPKAVEQLLLALTTQNSVGG